MELHNNTILLLVYFTLDRFYSYILEENIEKHEIDGSNSSRPDQEFGLSVSWGPYNDPPPSSMHSGAWPLEMRSETASLDAFHEGARSCRANSTRRYADLTKRSNAPVTQRIAPRLVYKKDAAFYCGIGVESFTANCPIAPIRVGLGMRGLRYDLRDLDGWINSLKQNSMSTGPNRNWLDRVGND